MRCQSCASSICTHLLLLDLGLASSDVREMRRAVLHGRFVPEPTALEAAAHPRGTRRRWRTRGSRPSRRRSRRLLVDAAVHPRRTRRPWHGAAATFCTLSGPGGVRGGSGSHRSHGWRADAPPSARLPLVASPSGVARAAGASPDGSCRRPPDRKKIGDVCQQASPDHPGTPS
ncbi:hypothetical protein ACP70R_033266 [Stipagrostis hirtigluma subsp. patula]